MKRIGFLFVFVLLVLPSDGARRWTPQIATTTGSYLVSQDFDGANTAPSGWTSSGSVTWNYATAPAPLIGSGSAALTAVNAEIDAPISPATGELWFFWTFTYTGSLTHLQDDIMDINGPGTFPASQHGRVFLGLSGQLGLEMEGLGSSSTSSGMTSGTSYDIWVHIKKGGSGTETLEGSFIAHGGTKPTSGANYVNCVNLGSCTDDYNQMEFFKTAGQNTSSILIYDKLRISASNIGSNPP